MNDRQLHEAFARIRRLSAKIGEQSGPGFVDVYLNDDDQMHTYEVLGVKSLVEFEDELLNAIVWVWSAKDYLKEVAKSCGNDPKDIEKLVNESKVLMFIADLANRSKHGNLRKSRSGKFAKLGQVSMSIPKSAIGTLTVVESHVSTVIAAPEEIEYRAPVESENGEYLADAGECLIEAIKIWEEQGFGFSKGT
ncbi:hypothetical protein [Spongiibacter marinus]|uniref:hypothetical protein n=1 Tax=Spongiibacter marinus TaxID=354246 RepID=UPI0035BE6E87